MFFTRMRRGQIFHTYAAYARGCEAFMGIYRILDVMPKGRNENGPNHALTDWARRTLYGTGGKVAANSRISPRGLRLQCPADSAIRPLG